MQDAGIAFFIINTITALMPTLVFIVVVDLLSVVLIYVLASLY